MVRIIGLVVGLVGMMQVAYFLEYPVPWWLWLIFDLFLGALLFSIRVERKSYNNQIESIQLEQTEQRIELRLEMSQQLRELREQLRKEVPTFPSPEDKGEASRADRPSPLRE